jgi:hypothetical protein
MSSHPLGVRPVDSSLVTGAQGWRAGENRAHAYERIAGG